MESPTAEPKTYYSAFRGSIMVMGSSKQIALFCLVETFTISFQSHHAYSDLTSLKQMNHFKN